LEAFELIAKDIGEVYLILLGDGVAKEAARQQVKYANLEKYVIFAEPFKYNIYEILTILDVFVFPSLHEGFPYSILEAMNAGCAIVSTDVGGIKEAITNGRNGLLVKPYNARMFAEKIKILLKDNDLRKNIGIEAKKTIEEKFSINNMKENVSEIYKYVLDNLNLYYLKESKRGRSFTLKGILKK